MDQSDQFPKRPKSPPTIRDVADRAGVSPATVSNVLGGKRGVTADSRRLVLQAASALGYRSNHMASSLRRGRTKTIAVVVPNLGNEFFSRLVTNWEALAADDGYEILVVASEDDPDKEARRIQSVTARRVDGLIVAAAQDDFMQDAPALYDLPPTVLVDRAFGCAGFDTVSSDNFEAGRIGARHLLSLGHRDIALLTSAETHLHLRNRIEGYRHAMAEACLSDRLRIVVGDQSVEGCCIAIERHLRGRDRPTAIFATTFFATLGAVKAIKALDISFPDAISLVGFEHSEWMTAFRPYLTAVSQQSRQLASVSWSVLLERIEGSTREPTNIRIPVSLAVRESSRPL